MRVDRDLVYGEGEARTLDVYRPKGSSGTLPAFLYLHGGGFSILSKDTHWMFGYGFARAGYVVFNANYRLAPRHRFPAALEDATEALLWVREHAAEYGADPTRLVVGGESAGANLSMSLTLASCLERPESFARRVFESGIRPRAVLPACGLLEVGNADRYLDRKELSPFVRARIAAVCRSYLPDPGNDPDAHAMADPLRVLEQRPKLAHPLPPIFAACGTADPVVDDTKRLEKVLRELGGSHAVRFYEGGGHAFHAMFMTEKAKECWRHHLEFLEANVGRT